MYQPSRRPFTYSVSIVSLVYRWHNPGCMCAHRITSLFCLRCGIICHVAAYALIAQEAHVTRGYKVLSRIFHKIRPARCIYTLAVRPCRIVAHRQLVWPLRISCRYSVMRITAHYGYQVRTCASTIRGNCWRLARSAKRTRGHRRLRRRTPCHMVHLNYQVGISSPTG